MHRPTTRTLLAAIVVTASIAVAGCGGGDDAAAGDTGGAAPTPTAPTPDATTPGSTVGGTTPLDPTAPAGDGTLGAVTGGAGDAQIPDLEGGELSGRLPALTGSSIFVPKAVEGLGGDNADTEDTEGDFGLETGEPTSTTTETTSTTEQIKVNYSGATIFLNGTTIRVTRGGTFPSGSPVFKLVGVTAQDIEIELLAGKFVTSNGTGLFLGRGELRVLANQSEQMTYRIKYLRPIAMSSDASTSSLATSDPFAF